MGLEGKTTRRSFLKQAGLVTGGAALASSVFGSVGTSAADAALPTWDQTADVVIVGGGGAGLAAAVEAARAGASVIVLEKAATTGGSTTLSGGVIQAAGTPQQKQFTKYQDDTPEKHYETWLLEGEGMVEEDLIKDHTCAMPAHIAWLESLGLEFDAVYGHCHVPYFDNAGVFADRIHVYKGGGAIGGGGPMVSAMETAAVAAGAVIQLSIEVTQPGHRRRQRRRRRHGQRPEGRLQRRRQQGRRHRHLEHRPQRGDGQGAERAAVLGHQVAVDLHRADRHRRRHPHGPADRRGARRLRRHDRLRPGHRHGHRQPVAADRVRLRQRQGPALRVRGRDVRLRLSRDLPAADDAQGCHLHDPGRQGRPG